jgi:hypothetical protein
MKRITLYKTQFKDIENGYPDSAWEEVLRELGLDADHINDNGITEIELVVDHITE